MKRLVIGLVLLVALIYYNKVAEAVVQPNQECPKKCGNQSIPFPFGTSPDCYLDDAFLVTCNNTSEGPKPYLKGNTPVFDISLLGGTLSVSSSLAHDCYNATGFPISIAKSVLGFHDDNKFSVSSARNKITVVGCDTYAAVTATVSAGGMIIRNNETTSSSTTTGCPSWCNSLENVKNGSCFGVGCCQMDIPARGLAEFELSSRSLMNHTRSQSFSPCGFAFVSQDGYYNFSSADLLGFQRATNISFPVLIDWAVENSTCSQANRNQTTYACRSENSECRDSINGYHCFCRTGFEGNPYLVDLEGGCLDINECEAGNPCSGICTNLPGNFSCSCPEGYEGDGKRDGIGCRRRSKDKGPVILYVALGITLGMLMLVAGGSWMYFIMRKRKLVKMREKFFHQNGGLMLLQKLSKRNNGSIIIMERDITFTEEDLKKATNNFDDRAVIGRGAFGTVYKGVLPPPDNKLIAIKKSRVTERSQIEQFINEVVILSQINHKNVVKLLGCCLETQVPLLVYEFINNGTLYKHIHDDEYLSSKLTWDLRLKIAAETAEAIACLHSTASVHPIIHRDIKTVNILLDHNYSAKVSDFGASRFIPTDQAQVTTLVQGTMGYLDPEYFHTSQLTAKSDVYSFGVVLAELITGEEALSFDRTETQRNLAMHFVSQVEQNRLLHVLQQSDTHHHHQQQLKQVAILAKRCLSVKSEERPTMKDVSIQLHALRLLHNNHFFSNDCKSADDEDDERSERSLSFNSINHSLNFISN